jgi:hypothetical protein
LEDVNGSLDENTKLTYPRKDSTFLEVIFEDQPFYNAGDYVAIRILPLGVFVTIPVILMLTVVPCMFCGIFHDSEV